MEKPRNLPVVAAVAALGLLAGGGLPAMAQQSNQPRAQNPQQQSQPNTSGSAQKKNSAQNQPAGQNQTASAKLDRKQIERVQRTLDQKGFKSGRADGIAGRETEAALHSFQQKQGLQANGQIDQQTLAALGLNDMAQPSTVGQSQSQNQNQSQKTQQQPAGSNSAGSQQSNSTKK